MNRTLALLLTLAVLLAHMLAIHKNLLGAIAPPYDEAHVVFRIARNLVESKSLAWDQGSPPVESFSSFLWVIVAAIGQLLNIPVTVFCQTVGAVSALITIFVLAQFSPVRLAGVIAPLLFVVSGGIAAAAASGTETSTFALFVVASFLAFERRAGFSFAAMLCLCVATREEGVGFALMLLALEIAGGLRQAGSGRVSLLRWFLPAACVVGAMTLLRHQLFGSWLSPYFYAWTRTDPERWLIGARYLSDFVRTSGWTLLLVFPLYYLARGTMTGVGRRAMLLSIGYAAMVVGQGGGYGPMFPPLVPMIALLLIAMQEAMTLALDSSRRIWPQVTWALFLLALSTSALGSKYPGDLSLLPLANLHRHWTESSTPPRLSYVDRLGRLGLVDEINATERLRNLGTFMREQKFDLGKSVLTPWPGAFGYLSRLRVIDALGRATLLPGENVPRPWSGVQRSDVLALLATKPDYIVPSLIWNDMPEPPPLFRVAENWVRFIDSEPVDESRTAAVREVLRTYELITVAVPIFPANSLRSPTRPFHLLRRRELNLTPKLVVEVEKGHYRVSVLHSQHEQIVDLRVVLVDSGGTSWSVLPTGAVRRGSTVMMRTSLLLFPSGDRTIELASGDILLPGQGDAPPDRKFVEL
ncbi:MAG: hypothetical protein ABIP42_16400, partial [Planctomycetota bacterium]